MYNVASTVILKSLLLPTSSYTNFSFTSTTNGHINIFAKYYDYKNYISLEMYRTENEGYVKLKKNLNGKVVELKQVNCIDLKLVTGSGDCGGYSLDKKNLITIFTYTNNIVVLFNKVVIIKHIENDLEVEDEAEESEDSTNNKAKAKFGFGISGQNNFIVDKIEVKELGIKEFLKYQSLLMDGGMVKTVSLSSSSYVSGKKVESGKVKEKLSEVGRLEVKSSRKNEGGNLNSGSNNRGVSKTKLKYNKLTNKFEEDEELTKLTSQVPITKPISSNKTQTQNRANSISKIELYCKTKGNPDYVCKYLIKIIKSNNIGLDTQADIDTTKLQIMIKDSCISQMKNELICNQILEKLNPVILILNL